MVFVEERIKGLVRAALEQVLERADLEGLPDFTMERPRSADHGDFATNVALVMAKEARMQPRKLAQAIVEALGEGGGDLSAGGCGRPRLH